MALIASAIVFIAAVITRPHEAAHAVSLTSATPAATSSPLATPRPTPRPAPWTDAQRADLRRAIENALAPGITGARAWSLLVADRAGDVLYSDGADRPVVPASAQKLIVADAALTQLGDRYRYSTLIAASKPPEGGVLNGDLWLLTSGDPSLRSADLNAGVHTLSASGLHEIAGSVVVDPSVLSGEEINPLWNADDANEDFMAATSGASLDEDTVEFRITGTQPGAQADVHVEPPTAPVAFDGTVQTGGGGDDVSVAGGSEPNHFHLSGAIPPGARQKFWVPVHGMPQYVSEVTTGLLKDDGIRVSGKAQTGTAPLDAQSMWHHRSAPLQQLVKRMLVFSDNHYAEQIMRTLGAAAGESGNDADGIAEELAVLRTQAIPTTGLHLVDGSGLAHANRVAARTLTGILLHFESQPGVNPLIGLLPRGGKDGTLKHYDFGAAAGRVRAKSGHLSDAASLAGYVDTQHHGRVVFTMLVNGSPGDPDTAIINAVDAIAQR